MTYLEIDHRDKEICAIFCLPLHNNNKLFVTLLS